MLVARLHAAEQGAVAGDAARRGDAGRIGQRGVAAAEHIPDMAAEIETAAGAATRRLAPEGQPQAL